jgi:hypothetical protein
LAVRIVSKIKNVKKFKFKASGRSHSNGSAI